MTSCDGRRRTEGQMMGKEERWHMWRKKVKARGRVEGTHSYGVVWSKGEAEMVREMETTTLSNPQKLAV